MAVAAVKDGAVVGGQDIIHHRRVRPADWLAGPGLDGPELEAAFRRDRPQRSRADPGEADSGANDQDEGQPQRDCPAAVGGAMGGFGGGHWWALRA